MGPGEYLAITVNRNGKRARAKNHYIHQLVLRMFGDTSPSPEHEVRHMDGDNLNNAIGNLAWGTRVENTQDKKLHGTFHEGERHGMAKLDEPTVIDIRRRHRGGESQTSIAKSLSVQQPQISRIVNRKLWTHIA